MTVSSKVVNNPKLAKVARERALRDIKLAQARIVRMEQDIDDMRWALYDKMLDAFLGDLDITQIDIAEAAGLTRGRIVQICDAARRHRGIKPPLK